MGPLMLLTYNQALWQAASNTNKWSNDRHLKKIISADINEFLERQEAQRIETS